jgi:hypothetical protein
MSAFSKPITYNSSTSSMNIDLSRFDTQYKQAQFWLDNEVLKDCGEYVPFKTGALFKSGDTATKPILGSGQVIWDEVYARNAYYGVNYNFSPAKHPLAQAYWFEGAKAVHKEKWLEIAKGKGGGG